MSLIFAKNTSRDMYRKDKPCNVPHYTEISYPSCACAPACPSSADPLDSRSIMLSGCWDNAMRKLEVNRLLYVYVVQSKLNHLNIAYQKWISMHHGQNNELNIPFPDLVWTIAKSSVQHWYRVWGCVTICVDVQFQFYESVHSCIGAHSATLVEAPIHPARLSLNNTLNP